MLPHESCSITPAYLIPLLLEYALWKLNQISGIKGGFLRDGSVLNRKVNVSTVPLTPESIKFECLSYKYARKFPKLYNTLLSRLIEFAVLSNTGKEMNGKSLNMVPIQTNFLRVYIVCSYACQHTIPKFASLSLCFRRFFPFSLFFSFHFYVN